MVIWLASARKQLQWRLIYAGKIPDTALRGSTNTSCSCMFCQCSDTSFWTEADATKPCASNNPESIRSHSQAGTSQNQPIIAQRSHARQCPCGRLPSQAARFSYDRRANCNRQPDFFRQAGHTSPTGNFSVLEKDPNHRSNIYGDFVDGSGRTVRAGVSAKIDAAPSGTHYVGASMKWFMRLTAE